MRSITANDILSYNFYTYGEAFTGSCDGLRYRIVMDSRENESQETIKVFSVSVWPEPYSFDHTAPDLIKSTTFPFTKEGHASVIDYLNSVSLG